jgi:hypothetical protein
VAAAAILAMTGLWALFGGHAREKAAPASHPVTPQVVLASAAPSASARAKEPSAEAPPSDAGLRKAVKPVATAPRPSTRVSARNARDELALLEQAQLALREAPNRALAATDLHAQRFPQSQYAQERELLAIDALTRLNDRERARAGAERFLARYPGSPHVRRVRELLASIVTTSTPVDRGAR